MAHTTRAIQVHWPVEAGIRLHILYHIVLGPTVLLAAWSFVLFFNVEVGYVCLLHRHDHRAYKVLG